MRLSLAMAAGSSGSQQLCGKSDSLHNMLLIVITVISLFVLALLVYVCVRFRASANPTFEDISQHDYRILWTVISGDNSCGDCDTIISASILRIKLDTVVIKVTGNQWYWNYEYPDENISFGYLVDEEELRDDRFGY